jgi:hypothetical protein
MKSNKFCQIKAETVALNRLPRLHVFPDGFEGVPDEIAANISGQIEPVRQVPKRLDEFSAEEVENFPKLWDYPEEYVVK